MTLNKIWIMSLLAILMVSCHNNDTDTQINTEDIYKKTNIYPLPPEQWMGQTNPYYTAGYVGDVMPYYENGTFHLFFLHDARTKPAGEGFHDIHSFETTDFINYNYSGRQIPYGKSDEPDFGVGTGSLVKVGNTYYYYYSGHNEIASFIQNNPRESVLLAKSTDMKNWTKVPNFKITAPAGYYNYDFRDPHVFFNNEDNKYWMLVSTQTDADRKAVVLKFTTTDPESGNWAVEGPVYTTTSDENYIMLECPDMFKMGNYWYLIFSENWSGSTGTHYKYSTSPNGPWISPAIDRLDGSYLYAAKTVSDNTNRYLVGWTARKVPENNTGGKDWAGNMVTHQLVQNTDGTLSVKQPESVASLFAKNVDLKIDSNSGATQSGGNFSMNSNSKVTFSTLQKANQITFGLDATSGQAGIILAQDGENGYKIAFEPGSNRIASYVVNAGSEELSNAYSLSNISGGNYEVKVVTSNDVCIVYINNKVAFSNRVYDVANKKWSIFSSSQSSFSNLTIKTPN